MPEPEWWLKRLGEELGNRRPELEKFDRYYRGEQTLAFATDKFKEVFARYFDRFSDNWLALVVDAVEERLNIEGFRFGKDADADNEAWAIWQRNLLDLDSQIAHTEALVKRRSYVVVWPDEQDEPEISIEDALDTIVAFVPGSRRKRAAALKRWVDDDEYLLATLYLPDGLYKFRSKHKGADAGLDAITWDMREEDGEPWPLPNPLGVVPVVPLVNKPRFNPEGLSELEAHIPLQDAVNKVAVDMLVASEYAAFRQRWATGLEIPRDPETGKAVEPFKHAVNRLWTSPSTETKFGEFESSNLENYVKVLETLAQHIASQSRTPPHYFFLRGDMPSGESLRAAETGLVAKARRRMRSFAESWEEVIRLAFAVKGDQQRAQAFDAETIWGDPESQTLSQLVDSLVKKRDLGIPDRQLWEDAGYSPQQITRFESMRSGDGDI